MKKLAYILISFFVLITSSLFLDACGNTEYTKCRFVGDSMSPTINDGQLVYYYKTDKFNNDDIVVIERATTIVTTTIIKRIIAKENQTITFYVKEEQNVNNEVFYVYDIVVKDSKGNPIKLDHSYLQEEMKTSKTSWDNAILENMSNDKVQIGLGSFALTLSKDEFFVMGDNRSDSLDSRHFGAINKNNILGKIDLSHKEK